MTGKINANQRWHQGQWREDANRLELLSNTWAPWSQTKVQNLKFPPAMSARLKSKWNDNSIALITKIFLFHYACESWTVTAELDKRTQMTEMRCFRQIVRISYKDHTTNEAVLNKIKHNIGLFEDLARVKQQQNRSGTDIITRSPGLAKAIMQSPVQERRKQKTIEWTGLSLAGAPIG